MQFPLLIRALELLGVELDEFMASIEDARPDDVLVPAGWFRFGGPEPEGPRSLLREAVHGLAQRLDLLAEREAHGCVEHGRVLPLLCTRG